ncbi:unnamed protein product [Phyllotreta striolata]|uniref:CUB domain-containing protein n=1 Tax=Phyllotreta striolata TaxID=444603 RepID=A0A9N9TTU1_PHYSR|nr:unnamed protein product [Phyllotreta striolata]
MDFHYPEVEFLTKDDRMDHDNNDFDQTFSASQTYSVINKDKDVRIDRKRFPRLRKKTQNSTFTLFKPVALSYVQKIPKPPRTQLEKEYSRYQEISTETTEPPQPAENINNILNKYINDLYNKSSNEPTTENSNFESDTQPYDDPSNSAETKFFDKSIWLAKKKKLLKFQKLLGLFTIVQFNNSECNANSVTGSYSGICYTSTECTRLEGTAFGDCAYGYGVCCVFRGSCGSTLSQNCSYFESPNYPDYYPPGGGVIIPTTAAPPTTANPSPTPDPRWGWMNYDNNEYNYNTYDVELLRQSSDFTLNCIVTVNKINSDITKMKIDFVDFELAGPTNGTCTIERLVITGQNINNMIPAICGYNTGQSIYVDVSQSDSIKLMVLSTMAFKKRFKIRICQFTDLCMADNCLQYYTGVTGTISSFNYDQAIMLNRSVPGYFNNMNYAICIKREPGYCSITYTNVANGIEYPFNLVNVVNGVSTVPQNMAGVDVVDCPNDYIGIDTTRLCGYKFNDGSVTANLSLNAPVTDTNLGPIVIPVRTNAAAVGYGFKLFYTQNRCKV